MLEQQAGQFSEQLKVIDQQTAELNLLKESISKVQSSKNKEMFSEIGKGIYIKGNLDNSQMLVDVGNKVLVPKNSKEIDGIIGSQVKKFGEIKKEISGRIDAINTEVNKIMAEAQKSQGQTPAKTAKKKKGPAKKTK